MIYFNKTSKKCFHVLDEIPPVSQRHLLEHTIGSIRNDLLLTSGVIRQRASLQLLSINHSISTNLSSYPDVQWHAHAHTCALSLSRSHTHMHAFVMLDNEHAKGGYSSLVILKWAFKFAMKSFTPLTTVKHDIAWLKSFFKYHYCMLYQRNMYSWFSRISEAFPFQYI